MKRWVIHGCFCNIRQFWLRKLDGLRFVPDFGDQGFEKCFFFKCHLKLRVNSFGVLQVPSRLFELKNGCQSIEKLSLFWKGWAIHELYASN